MTACITADGRFERRRRHRHDGMPALRGHGADDRYGLPVLRRLKAERPAQMGIVLQCSACKSPVFLRYRTRAWRDDRVELHPLPQPVEHPPERFSLSYLPAPVAARFREALACFSSGLWQAFAAMCRQTSRAVFEDVGDAGRLRVFDLVAEIQQLGEIDEATFNAVCRVIFDPDEGARLEPALRTPAGRRAARDHERPADPDLCAQGEAEAGAEGAAVLCQPGGGYRRQRNRTDPKVSSSGRRSAYELL